MVDKTIAQTIEREIILQYPNSIFISAGTYTLKMQTPCELRGKGTPGYMYQVNMLLVRMWGEYHMKMTGVCILR